MSQEQLAEFDLLVENGPDVERDGVVRWRRADLKAVVERRFGCDLRALSNAGGRGMGDTSTRRGGVLRMKIMERS